MTKMTGTDLKRILEAINDDFLLITKHHDISLKDHFDAFLKVFEVHLDGATFIKCLVPVFFEIKEWEKWGEGEGLKPFSWLGYIGCVDKESMNTIYSIQNYVSDNTQPFTRTVLNYLNVERNLRGRKTVKITVNDKAADDEKLDYKEINRIQVFSVSASYLKRLKSTYKVPSFTDTKSSSITKGQLVENNLPEDFPIIEEKEIGEGFNPGSSFEEKLIKRKGDKCLDTESCAFAKKIAVPVMHHALYTSVKYDLYYFFSNTVFDKGKNGKEKDLGLGGLFVLVDKMELKKEDEAAFVQQFEHLADKLANRVIHYYRMEENLKHARKAAISQVMARNMSHNIGSHVLAKLTSVKGLSSSNDNILKKVAKLNEYLKLRMDFLADIATSVPTFEVSKNLRNDVIKWLHQDGSENQQKFILQHITGNEKKVSVKFGTITEDKMVAFPNDILGVQALYVIIENIIRNTAKHSYGGDFELRFKIEEDGLGEFYALTIYDNCNGLTKDTDLVDNQNARIKLLLLKKDGALRPKAWGVLEMKVAAAYLRKIDPADLDKPCYNPQDDTEPVSSREGKNKKQKKPPLLQAIEVPENGKKHLGYKLYLLKPKHLLILDPNKSLQIEPEKIQKLRSFGIWYHNDCNQPDFFKYSFGHELMAVVNPKSEDIQVIEKESKNFPIRKFIVNGTIEKEGYIQLNINNFKKKLSGIKNKNTTDTFLTTFWLKWTEEIGGKQNVEALAIKLCDTDNNGGSQCQESIELYSNNGNSVNRKEAVLYNHTCRDYSTIFSNSFYFEQYGKGTSPLLPPVVDKIKGDDNILKKQFAEAILCRVAIVDERIQEIAEWEEQEYIHLNGNGHPKLIDALEKTKLWILPCVNANLNAAKFTTEIIKAVKGWITDKIKHMDFLVIHLGILERICKTVETKDENKIATCISEFQTVNKNCKIVVISGRGKPDTLPEDTLFLHYSLVSQYVLEAKSKFHLSQLLYSARKQK